MMINSTQKVNFLIVGTQKAGTSALDRYLRRHPEVGMARRKEVHYFDNENVFSNSVINYKIYESEFDFSTNKKTYGEATPIYMYWQPCCRRIWEYSSQIKLIFILRNPIDRAFSHWNMEYNRKLESNNFSYCIRNEGWRTKKALPDQHRIYSYIDRGFYSEQIRRYKCHFSEKQMLFIKYEAFKNNQEKELNRIFNFLEVNPNLYYFEEIKLHVLKKHGSISEIDKKYLINIFEFEIHQIERMLDWDCSDWLK